MRINNNSQELILEALTTIPIYPEITHALFLPKGGMPSQDNEEAYLRECKKRGIIPYHDVKFRLGRDRKGTISVSSDIQNLNKRLVPEFINGGKFESIELEAFSKEEYPLFIQTMLPSFVNNGYEVRSCGLGLFGAHISSYLSGTYGIAQLTAESQGCEGYRGLELELGFGVKPEESEKLQSWFSGLAQKYSRGK